MAQIFVSYSRVDAHFVTEFVAMLERLLPRDDIWYDDLLEGGDFWWNEILKQIKHCDIFIYVLSNESIISSYCQAEFEEACRLQKRVIAVQARDRTRLTLKLQEIQYIDMKAGVNDASAVVKLSAAINKQKSLVTKKRPLWPQLTPKPISSDEPERPINAPDITTPTLTEIRRSSANSRLSRLRIPLILISVLLLSIGIVYTALTVREMAVANEATQTSIFRTINAPSATPRPRSANIDGIQYNRDTDEVVVYLMYGERQAISGIRITLFDSNNTQIGLFGPLDANDQFVFFGRAGGLQPGQSYTVRVQALDDSNAILNTSTQEFTYTPIITLTPTEVIISALIEAVTFDTEAQQFILRLSYENVELIDSIEIDILDQNGLLVDTIVPPVQDLVSYTPGTKLIGQQQYTFQIKAINADGRVVDRQARPVTDPRTWTPEPPTLAPNEAAIATHRVGLTMTAMFPDLTRVVQDFEATLTMEIVQTNLAGSATATPTATVTSTVTRRPTRTPTRTPDF